MALSHAFSGSFAGLFLLQDTQSGDLASGGPFVREAISRTWDSVGGTAPIMSGWLAGQITCAAGDWRIADADPFQAMGAAVASPGLVIDGSKLRGLLLRNNDTANTVTIVRGAANGLVIFTAAGAGIDLEPGATWFMEWPTGKSVSTTTDKLTLSVSAGSPSVDVCFVFGP